MYQIDDLSSLRDWADAQMEEIRAGLEEESDPFAVEPVMLLRTKDGRYLLVNVGLLLDADDEGGVMMSVVQKISASQNVIAMVFVAAVSFTSKRSGKVRHVLQAVFETAVSEPEVYICRQVKGRLTKFKLDPKLKVQPLLGGASRGQPN